MAIETTSDLSSVVSSQIVDGAVTSSKIGAGAVGSAAISAGSINSTHIGANAVVSGDIAAGAVGSAELADNAVVAAKIAAASIGTAKLDSGAATSGQLLQANGSGGASFSTVTSGGMVLISSTTITSASNISFTSIPTTYNQLIVVVEQAHMSTHAAGFRINSDATSAYYWNSITLYSDASLGANASDRSLTTPNTYFGRGDDATAPVLRSNTTSDVGTNTTTMFRIYNASSSTSIKMCSWESFGFGAYSYRNPRFCKGYGYWNSTSAVTSITSVSNSGTGIISARVYLYGLS
jgi:hypothetical protein